MYRWLLVLSLVLLCNGVLLPVCDPLLEGFPEGSCMRVSVIYDPHEEGDTDHCVCQFIIKEASKELGIELYRNKLIRCAFAEATDALKIWDSNNCNETIPSPRLNTVNLSPLKDAPLLEYLIEKAQTEMIKNV